MDDQTLDVRTEQEIRCEMEAVEAAREDIRAGRVVPHAAVKAWISQLEIDPGAPPPFRS